MSLALVITFAFLGVTFLLASYFFRPSPHKLVEEFEQDFPGKCGVCAYHSFRIHEGRAPRGSLPGDHRCPEKWGRWKGALH